MMDADDIVERLRNYRTGRRFREVGHLICLEAADRITDLEAQLAARDAEIAAWLREANPWHGVDPHTANCLANMIEARSYRKEAP